MQPPKRRWRAPLAIALAAACAACGTAPAVTPAARPQPPDPNGVVSDLAPYSLAAPLSREVVLPAGGALRVLGGLDASGQTVGGVFDLDPATGSLSKVGQMARAVHDAAGAVVGGRDLVFGGGSPFTTATVQSFGRSHGRSDAAIVGALPRGRSDLVALSAGGRAYVLAGYDGSSTEAAVLATADGRSFTRVATLPDPVRYPAAAELGGAIYLFGGADATGSRFTTAIQRVDLATGRARVVGNLAAPLAHGAAAVIGGAIYVLGGDGAGGAPTPQIERFDPATDQMSPAGDLPLAVADPGIATIGATTYLVGGEDAAGSLSTVVEVRPAPVGAAAGPTTGAATGVPFTGKLLIADRGNNRLLVVNAAKQILWTYPSASAPAPPGSFYFPDDAFFAKGGTEIISNEEGNDTIVQIAFPSGKLLWSYGHAGVPGSAPGYLDQPDDAYLLRDGTITVADAMNCRILFISPAGVPTGQIGTTRVCAHRPPQDVGYPNGDTPLANGDILVSEIDGSWVSEYTPGGHLVWSLHLPIAYPSDPQQLGPDLYLIADYASPGALYEFNRQGQILWSYAVTSGPGMLDHPSLAERLPNGLIAVNDDYNDRVVIINPADDQIVWQYGITGQAGTAPGQLNTPDGFDLLTGTTTPTHPQTG